MKEKNRDEVSQNFVWHTGTVQVRMAGKEVHVDKEKAKEDGQLVRSPSLFVLRFRLLSSCSCACTNELDGNSSATLAHDPRSHSHQL